MPCVLRRTILVAILLVSFKPAAASVFLHYSFNSPDSAADGLATDNSGNGRTGSLQTVAAGAYSFSGETTGPGGDQSLELMEAAGVGPARLSTVINPAELDYDTGDWTVALWCKRRDADSTDFLFHMGGGDGFGGADELHLHDQPNGDLVLFHHAHLASDDVVITIPGVASPASWFHAAVVHDATLGQLQLFVNGTPVGTDASFSLEVMSQVAPFVFGGAPTDEYLSDRWLDGWLDEACIFDAALDATAIQQLAVPEPTTALLLISSFIGLPRRR